jgi:lipopolysaccharide assembly outer membrane protein LptD (OstA)
MRRADVVPDSVAMATEALSADTAMVTPADSLANDTASQRTDLEAPVVYQSQDSMVWYKNGNAYLYGSGQVNYQKIELKANEITIDLETSTVYAQGTTDTLGNVT